MNEKLIFEIGDICRVRFKGFTGFRGFYLKKLLTPEEILESWEVKRFLENYPELKRLCGEEKNENI